VVAGNVKFSRLARVGALALAWGGALACTPYATLKTGPVDCSAASAYQVNNIDAVFSMSWISNDSTPGSVMTADVESIPGGLCGDTTALVVRGSHNNDWGSAFGFYSFGKKDESTQVGLSFWARAPGNTTKGFTILLDDPNTYDPYVTCTPGGATILPPGDAGANCTTYCTLDAGLGVMPPTYDSNGMPLSSGTLTAPPPANACGNSYQTELLVTGDWVFYTIPFDMFQQTLDPNKVPTTTFTETGSAPGTTLLTSAIMNMVFRMPKEGAIELWIDQLGFYRQKAAGDASGDGS
jgi:hypothetical protein